MLTVARRFVVQARRFSTMRASVLTKAHATDWEMGVEELQMPVPRANEALIRVRATGVCHTDLHVMKGEVGFPVPAVMGHETSGELVEFGKGTDVAVHQRLSVGDAVVCPFIMPCGSCGECSAGNEDLCTTFFRENRGKGTLYDGESRLFRQDGTPLAMYSMAGMAEYAVVPTNAVFRLPDSVAQTLAVESAVIGCAVFTAYGAVKNAAKVQVGENVIVLGAGGVGANVLQVARAFGADRIVAVDIDDAKLKAMEKLGATHTINVTKTPNLVEAVMEATGGRGADVAIEALGRKDTFEQAVDVLKDGGRAVVVGIAPAGVEASVEITRLVRRKLVIAGSYGARARRDMPEILRLVEAGKVDIGGVVTRRYSLDEAAQAYRDLDRHEITGRAVVVME